MKNQLLLSVLLYSLFTGILSSQTVTLNFDDSVVDSSTPATGKAIQFDLVYKKNSCVEVFGSNQGSDAVKLVDGKNPMSVDERADALTIVKLQMVRNTTDGRRYVFGRTCAERLKADANVKVTYGNFSADKPSSGSTVPFRIEMPANEVLTVNSNTTQAGATNNKQYLMVEATKANTAKISINDDNNRGKCLVALVTPGPSGKTIALLDPKNGPTSFFTDKNVYVVPVIKATVGQEADKKSLDYQVGDPKRNAKIIVEEI